MTIVNLNVIILLATYIRTEYPGGGGGLPYETDGDARGNFEFNP